MILLQKSLSSFRSPLATMFMAALLFCTAVTSAEAVINVSVAPGGSVDIMIDSFRPSHTSSNGPFTWLALAGPFANGTTDRSTMSGISVYRWGDSSGNFNATSPNNRVLIGEALRYTNNGIGLNTTVSINATWGNGFESQAETVNVLITNGGASVVSINRMDADPTVAASARWQVVFDQAVAGVTAGNFQLSGEVTGAAITSVTGSGNTWTVTAGTGTGTGHLGLNMANSTGVTPQVLGLTFTGQSYSFPQYPLIVTEPANVTVLSGQNATLAATASCRNASGSNPIQYQWYNAAAGSKTNPVCAQGSVTASPADISCTVGPLTATPANGYWVEVWNNDPLHNTSTDGRVTVVSPPATTVATASLSADTGSSSTDWLTNTASQTISGTLSANLASGESVQVSYNGGSSWTAATTYSVGSNTWSTTATLSGSNTFEARVTNSNGSSTAFTHAYTLDTTPPSSVLSTLADGSLTNNATLNVSGSVSDANGIQSVLISNQTTTVSATLSTTNNVDYTFSYPVTLATGSNTITIIATDNAGNTATDTRTIVLDTTAPNLMISGPADNSVTSSPTVTVSGTTDTTATVLVSINSGPSVTAGVNVTSFSLPINLAANAINTIDVYATDLAGNTTTGKRTVTNDQANPSLAVTIPNADAGTNQTSITLSGTVSDLTNVSLTATCPTASIGTVNTPTATTWNVDLSNLQTGVNIVTIKATDQVGNSTSVIRNIIYTATPVTIDAVMSPTSTNSQTITGTREENAAIAVTCATAMVGVVTYPSPTTWQVDLTLMSQGTNTIMATATDALGNTSSPTTAVVVVSASSAGAPTGDITGNGEIDVRDALKALMIASGMENATADDLAAGDVAPLVNNAPQPDGKINVGDVVVILRKAVGLETW